MQLAWLEARPGIGHFEADARPSPADQATSISRRASCWLPWTMALVAASAKINSQREISSAGCAGLAQEGAEGQAHILQPHQVGGNTKTLAKIIHGQGAAGRRGDPTHARRQR